MEVFSLIDYSRALGGDAADLPPPFQAQCPSIESQKSIPSLWHVTQSESGNLGCRGSKMTEQSDDFVEKIKNRWLDWSKSAFLVRYSRSF